MKFRSIMIATVALAMTSTPVLAQAGSEKAKPSIELTRATKKTTDQNELTGVPIFVAVLAAASIIAGIVVVADQESDTPVSPN